jgi:NAD(P)-dependent dehydrogenase (short-subunit alcohol dehydrogenase family)
VSFDVGVGPPVADSGQRHAVVTGCSSGIGRAIAEHLLAEGWRVTGLSRREVALGDSGASFTWLGCDLSEPGGVAEAVAGVGPVDAIVHAAGYQVAARLGDLDPAALAGMFAVHVGSAAALVDSLVGRLADGGRIVLIGSRTAEGVAGKSQYAATKAALVALARSWAQELAPRGVTANVVAPGPTDTPMLHDPARASVAPVVPPLGALVDPADVAALVAFVLGPHGRSITGQALVVCGGASL